MRSFAVKITKCKRGLLVVVGSWLVCGSIVVKNVVKKSHKTWDREKAKLGNHLCAVLACCQCPRWRRRGRVVGARCESAGLRRASRGMGRPPDRVGTNVWAWAVSHRVVVVVVVVVVVTVVVVGSCRWNRNSCWWDRSIVVLVVIGGTVVVVG